ncbi:MAG: hypothetical protein KAX31_02175, partial [Thermoplasmata archaeon]|nr:hypothetical protein [Thermoplasmata archaeon]
KQGATLVRGWCLAENLEPMMPVKEALRCAELYDLISESPPPRVLSVYLVNNAGMLVSKVERSESDLDADIFASMLSAVGNFVEDSLSMMGKGSAGELNTIGYSNFKIILQSRGGLSLAVVIEGSESEFLIDDIISVLTDIGDRQIPDMIEESTVAWIEPKIQWFISSGKYDGAFIVDDPRLRQENLFDNVLLGLQRASVKNPVVFFLDDIQWADPTTLNLLHYLARNTKKNRIILLATYRPEDLAPDKDGTPHHLETTMQNMSRESLFKDIALQRLGKEDTEKVVTNVLGALSLPAEFKERIFKETEGNPFFVLELLHLLVEEGHISRADDAWQLLEPIEDIQLPSRIYDV